LQWVDLHRWREPRSFFVYLRVNITLIHTKISSTLDLFVNPGHLTLRPPTMLYSAVASLRCLAGTR
jgi:hypothetical protein